MDRGSDRDTPRQSEPRKAVLTPPTSNAGTTRESRSSSVDNLHTWDEFLALSITEPQLVIAATKRKPSSGKSQSYLIGEQRKSTASSGSNTPTIPAVSSSLAGPLPPQRDNSRDLITSSSPPGIGQSEGVVWDAASLEQLSSIPPGRPKSVTLSLSGKLPPRNSKTKTPPLSPTHKIQQIVKAPSKEIEQTKQDFRDANIKLGEIIDKTFDRNNTTAENDEKGLKDSRKSNREKEKDKEKAKEDVKKLKEDEKKKREALEKQQKQERLMLELRKIKDSEMQKRAARGQPGSGYNSPIRENTKSPAIDKTFSGPVPLINSMSSLSIGPMPRAASSARLVRSDDAIGPQTIEHSSPSEVSPPSSPPVNAPVTRPSPRRAAGNAMGVSDFFASATSPSRVRQTDDFSVVIPITSSEHSFALAELLSRHDLFTTPDSEENIVYSSNRSDGDVIEAATIEKLVEKLAQDSTEMRFVFTFLLTYRYIVTSDQLLVLIIARYNTPPPHTVNDVEQWKSVKLKPVRIRVLNVLRHWLEKFPKDWTPELLNTLSEWIDSCSDHTPTPSAVLGRTLGKLRAQRIQSAPTHLQVLSNALAEETTQPPRPQLPPTSANAVATAVDICDLPALELARQLTICDWILLRKIEPKEFLEKRWQCDDARVEAPNLLAYIDHFNAVSTWVVTELLFEETLKSRASVLAKMIHTAEQLKLLKNFSGFMEIASGLKQPAVQRLSETWAAVPPKTTELWDQLTELSSADAGYASLRNHIAGASPPSIPHFAILLQDLIYTEEGNQLYIRENRRMVNVTKLRRMSDLLTRVLACQEKPYVLEPLPAVQDFLCSLPTKRQLTPDEQIEISYMREDRKKKHVHSHSSGTGAVFSQQSPVSSSGNSFGAMSSSLSAVAAPVSLSGSTVTSPSSFSTNLDSG